MSVKVFYSACSGSHRPASDSATHVRQSTQQHSCPLFMSLSLTFAALNLRSENVQKKIACSMYNYSTWPRRYYSSMRWAVTCNMYGVEQQCVQGFDVENW